MSEKILAVKGELRWDVIEDEHGLQWVIDQGTSQDWAGAVSHEREPEGASFYEWLCAQFEPGRVFLDVGAHVGMYALRAAAAGCHVVAVEANPETAGFLRMNRILNGFDFPIWAVAAWDEITTLTLSNVQHGIMRSMNATVAGPYGYDPMGITVAAMPLDILPWPHDRLDVVKLDVEGSDIHVLTGMRGLLETYRPLIVWEDHSQYQTYTEADAVELMASLPGYTWKDRRDLGIRTADNRWRFGFPDGNCDSRGRAAV